jgi:hypothetical protein
MEWKCGNAEEIERMKRKGESDIGNIGQGEIEMGNKLYLKIGSFRIVPVPQKIFHKCLLLLPQIAFYLDIDLLLSTLYV